MFGTPTLEVKSSISSLRITPVLLAMTPAPNQSLSVYVTETALPHLSTIE